MNDSRRKLSFWRRDVRCEASLGIVMSVGLALMSLSAMAADSGTAPNGPIPPTFFGLHMHKPMVMGHQPWPTVPFGSARLWGCGVYWAQVNTSKGVYDWSLLDKWLDTYHEHGVDDLMYTFGRVPRWASSKPNDSSCLPDGPEGGLGVCDPPNDLQPDGTGSNQHWKDFVTAIATRNKSKGGHIRYWEIWNEPFMPRQWTGSNAQLERMAQDAREILLSIDPAAVIVSPPPAMKTPGQRRWIESFLHDGGGKHADVIGLHGYIHTGQPGSKPDATEIVAAVQDLRKMWENRGMASMPIFDTEAGWGRARVMGFEGDEDFEAGFLAQFYLLHWSAGVSRFYWYSWNNADDGTLWSPEPGNPSGRGRLHKAGVAYQQVHDWMVGATMSPLCSSTGDRVWTCGFTRPGGYEALAVWSTGGNKSYSANPKFKKLRDLDGNTSPIVSGKVNIGFNPVLLQNQ